VILTDECDRERLIGFLANQLELDDRLDFLTHVETCGRCWDEVYNARKAEHPHYYKTSNRQVKLTDKELKRIDGALKEEDQFQVA
jgi:hypothetical protein